MNSVDFGAWTSIEIAPGKWTNTYVMPVRHDRGLPPWDYANAIRAVVTHVPRAQRERGMSLWTPVTAPGRWYFDEIKYALMDLPLSFSATASASKPVLSDFSCIPPTFSFQLEKGGLETKMEYDDLSENAQRCLTVMARLVAAYTSEVASLSFLSKPSCLDALRELEGRGLVEWHADNSDINLHLESVERRASHGSRREEEKKISYWRIKRPGLSAALRIWGVPPRASFFTRMEKNRLLDGIHRRRCRQWPAWLRKAFPQADVYAGWSEVGIPNMRTNPDALAWGTFRGAETLFWLEVESGKSSRRVILEKTRNRWLKASYYADISKVRLVFVFLAAPWVRDASRMAFTGIGGNCAVVVADWARERFGTLPYPKWGEAVIEA